MSKSIRTTVTATLLVGVVGLALAGCASSDPTTGGGSTADAGTVRIGSAGFSENEILGYVYGEALADAGVKVEYNLNIGSREVYIAALTSDKPSIDFLPEYSGALLYYYDKAATAVSSDDVTAALPAALPAGYEVLDSAAAEDKDSLNVTPEFAAEHNLRSIGDLVNVGPFKLGANPEFANPDRPYSPAGLAKAYGLNDIELVSIDDGGGPKTLDALLKNDVQVADIYSTTPSISENNLVTLEDPKNLFVAQNITPYIAKERVSADAIAVINKVSAALTTKDLLDLNTQVSGADKVDAKSAATAWLKSKGLIG